MISNNARTLFGMLNIKISRAAELSAELSATAVEHVSANHDCPNIAVAKEFLHGAKSYPSQIPKQ